MIASSQDDFLRRRGLAWANFWKLHKLWISSNVPLALKLRLFDSLILSILLYGSETWTINTNMKNRLDSFGTSCYRIMLGIRRIDRVRNTQVLSTTKRQKLSDFVYRRQLRALGHWLRSDGACPSEDSHFLHHQTG